MATGPMPGWAVLMILFAPYSINLACSAQSLLLQASLAELLHLDEQRSGLLPQDVLEALASNMRGSDLCCVCMDTKKDAVLTPCGHRAICVGCGDELHRRGRGCPVCRQTISGVVRVFDS